MAVLARGLFNLAQIGFGLIIATLEGSCPVVRSILDCEDKSERPT